MMKFRHISWALLLLSVVGMAPRTTSLAASDDWHTVHVPGYCATYDICGNRDDIGTLSCADNRPARYIASDWARRKLQTVCPQLASHVDTVCCSEAQLDQLETQIQLASTLLVGCPACNHNFKHLFCMMTCSPDQATFTNVTSVQTANDTGATNAVREMEVYIAPEFGTALFNSCADVTYAPLNMKSMALVGGGAKNYQEWLDFLGLSKEKRSPPQGSPFQINFPNVEKIPKDMSPMNDSMTPCGSGPLACSCGDCPNGDSCQPPLPVPSGGKDGACPALGLHGSLRCLDLGLIVLYILVLITIPTLLRLGADEEAATSSILQPLIKNDTDEIMIQDEAEASTSDAVQTNGTTLNRCRPQPITVNSHEEDQIEYPASEQLGRKIFRWIGYTCAKSPWTTITTVAVVALLVILGILRLVVETEPQKLWVGPGSQAAAEKAIYEDSFGPFYRITQFILSTKPQKDSGRAGPILTNDNVRLLFDMHKRLDTLSVNISNAHVTLENVCFKPLGDVCAVQSVVEYWQGSRDAFEQAVQSGSGALPSTCVEHWNTQCRASTGAPVDPKVVLGGFPRNMTMGYADNATAFIVTLPLSSSVEVRENVKGWEKAFIELASKELSAMAEEAGLQLSFSTERSVADELKRESGTDVGTVAASYIAMFIYVAVALGRFPQLTDSTGWKETLLVHSRISLAFGGVFIVAIAVAGALGLCGWLNIGATLIIMEVIPFLVLAVGVDNVFILTQAADKVGEGTAPAIRAAEALAASGPSMLLAAASETLGFAVGTLTSMPALRDFAACAAFAILFDFLLQIILFPAMLALDAQRVQDKRYDVIFWVRQKQVWKEEDDEIGQPPPQEYWGVTPALQRYMTTIHAPVLRTRSIKAVVIATFAAMFLYSCAMLPRLERGLDQQVALPQDSYLQWYFSDVQELLRVGPPVSFVVRDLNVSDAASVARICSVAGCQNSSLLNQIAQAARAPSTSWLNTPASSYLDDFLSWISPEIPQCCRLFPNNTACPPPDQSPCWDGEFSIDTGMCSECSACFAPEDLPAGTLPGVEDFQRFLPQFMSTKPSQQCAKGGVGAYDDAIQYNSTDLTSIAGLSSGNISSSMFTAYYVPLSSQSDFIQAMAATRELAAKTSSELDLNIFSYSIFHIFFEQYLTIGGEALTMLGSAAVAIFVLCLIALGSSWAALLLLATLSMLCVDLAGVMVLAGIKVNAVSLVQLVAAVGIGVEFCVHVVHAFMEASGTKQQRVDKSLAKAGAAVLSGITVTKLVGVAVLGFAQTAIFRVYFFHFYLALVVLGAMHGLVVLPVMLSLAGPGTFGHTGP